LPNISTAPAHPSHLLRFTLSRIALHVAVSFFTSLFRPLSSCALSQHLHFHKLHMAHDATNTRPSQLMLVPLFSFGTGAPRTRSMAPTRPLRLHLIHFIGTPRIWRNEANGGSSRTRAQSPCSVLSPRSVDNLPQKPSQTPGLKFFMWVKPQTHRHGKKKG
jgi:hypothetical protein